MLLDAIDFAAMLVVNKARRVENRRKNFVNGRIGSEGGGGGVQRVILTFLYV